MATQTNNLLLLPITGADAGVPRTIDSSNDDLAIGVDIELTGTSSLTIGGNLTVNGTTTTVDSELQTADRFILLNSEYTTNAAVSAGLVMNIDPASASFSITDITSNVITVSGGDPSLTGAQDGVGGIADGDFILIQNPANPANAGLFEVASTTATTITIEPIPANSGIFGTSLTNDATSQGTVVATAITVLQSDSAGTIQKGFAAAGTLSFDDLGTAGAAGGWTDDGTTVRLTSGTDNVSIGSATALGKLSIDGDTDEVQLLVQGNAVQTANIFVVEDSAAADLFTVSGSGVATFNIGDNTTDSFKIQEGLNNYLEIDTSDLQAVMEFGNATTSPNFTFLGTGQTEFVGNVDAQNGVDVTGANLTLVDNLEIVFGTGSDWSLGYADPADDLELIGNASTPANTAGSDFTATGSVGGIAGTSAAAGTGGGFAFTAGAGGAATTTPAVGETAGVGGAITLTSGIGGAGDGTGDYDGAIGGAMTFTAGAGGAGAVGQTGGLGGEVTITGGAGGSSGGGTAGNGGDVTIAGGDGLTDGDVNIGATTTNAINLGVAAGPTVNIDTDTESTTIATGALVVDGGVGIAKDVYIGGDIVLSDTTEATITMAERTGDPSTPTDQGIVYVKSDGGDAELFYADDQSNFIQITKDGKLNVDGSSITSTFTTSGTTVTIGDALYLTSTNGIVDLADANLAGGKFLIGFAEAGAAPSSSVEVQTIQGAIVTVNSNLSGDTPGDVVYLSETAGQITTTAPTNSGSDIYRAGFVVNAAVAGTATILLSPQFIGTVP